MKKKLRDIIQGALETLVVKNGLTQRPVSFKFVVEKPANPNFGHFSTNAAMTLVKDFQDQLPGGKNPTRQLAELIVNEIKDEPIFQSVEIAGPGFINFRLTSEAWYKLLEEILGLEADYGRGKSTGRKVLIEFVSSNPTGPLHVGHGRGGAWGDAMCRILEFLGDQVSREYYINDAGNQINTLGASVLFRFKNPEQSPPPGLYQGDYILEIANVLKKTFAADFWEGEDSEKIPLISQKASSIILEGMKKDLEAFGIHFDTWFSEKSLYSQGEVAHAISTLKDQGLTYEQEGALFFRTTDFGDDKDRVLIKSDGSFTYFASDVAYHLNKYSRGYDLLVDVLGADHGGYVGRMTAVVLALGHPKESLKIILYQLVRLFRGKELVRMSTRAGEFIPLKLVIDEVGPDAARFLYLTQSHDSTLDFDLELAKAKNNDNPVFYVQYLCARIFQVIKRASPFLGSDPPDFSLLKEKEELDLIFQLESFPETLQTVRSNFSPHLLTVWLLETAKLFHHYYGAHRIILEDNLPLTRARVALAKAVRGVVARGLTLLGVSVPERMEDRVE
ncbi:MAG: arginine--tRNA ligase [Deltaproteobacteria bacterium]|jgi:arginyl-tRNA synthetase|nr:arginine--tRNA ligase [Deltaproteobacteria bacterium]